MPIAAVVYDAARLITGLAVAVALLAVAAWLVCVTDWSSPEEDLHSDSREDLSKQG